MVSPLGTAYVKEFVKSHKLEGKKMISVGCGDTDYGFNGLINFDELDWTKHKNMRNFVQGNAEKMPFEDETFDAVLLVDMLEHSKHPHLIMKEVSRVLKKGGLLCTINTFLFQMHGNEIKGLEYADYWRFTSQGIKLLCNEAGLKVIENVYYESGPECRWVPDVPQSSNIGFVKSIQWLKIHTIGRKDD